MGCISNGNITITGNFAKISKKKPRGFDKDYKVIVPFDFKWRKKIGKVTCDCKEVLECYMPYYGFTWYHSEECALIRLLKEKPHLKNLPAYDILPMIAQSE